MPFFSRYSNSLILLRKRSNVSGANTFLNGNGANIFTVPDGVTIIHAVAIGGGGTGSGARSTQNAGGGGGGLGYVNNKSVTAGQQLLVYAGHGGNAAVTSTTTWATAIYEEAYGQDSFVATLDATITGCSAANTATPITTDVTVSCSSTTGLSSGMTVVVGSGSGKLQNRTTVVSVTNSTAFVISAVPIRTLSSATIYASSNVFVRGNGGGYPTGFNPASGISSSSYVNNTGGAGGGRVGDGGGTGGNGGNVGYFLSGGTTYGGSAGGGGGAAGYSGNGGAGGASNGSVATNPTSGSAGSGGGGGGGSGGYFGDASSGYSTMRAGHGGAVDVYGGFDSGAGGVHKANIGDTGQSGIGGSNGGISNNYVVISTRYPGANGTNISDSAIRAGSTPNFSVIKAGWAAKAPLGVSTPFNGVAFYVSALANSTSGTMSFNYTSTKTNSTNNIVYYHSGYVNPSTNDLDYGAGSGSPVNGGRGAVRIIWGSGRAFPNTNVSTD